MFNYYTGTINKKSIKTQMQKLANLLSYKYKNITWLAKAMYAKKIDNKNEPDYYNSSLATLGDTVLKCILAEILFDQNKTKQEITLQKSEKECNKKLHEIDVKLKIYTFAYNDQFWFEEAIEAVKLSHTMPVYLLPNKKHELYLEAIIGAIYKDKGINYCKKWYFNFLNCYNNKI